jgi:hypothetical protein
MRVSRLFWPLHLFSRHNHCNRLNYHDGLVAVPELTSLTLRVGIPDQSWGLDLRQEWYPRREFGVGSAPAHQSEVFPRHTNPKR